MPLGFHAMETLVIAVVLFVEYRLERGGRVWAVGAGCGQGESQTETQTDRQALVLFSLPGAQGSWRWRFKGSARMTSAIRTKAVTSPPQAQLKPPWMTMLTSRH